METQKNSNYLKMNRFLYEDHYPDIKELTFAFKVLFQFY